MPRRKGGGKPRRQYCRTSQGETKVIFHTELDAKIEASKHAAFDTDSRYYKCRFGNHYHFSTQEQKTER